LGKIKKILIANRGEISRRIQRTCRDLEIKTVAVFTGSEKNSPYVTEADDAISLGSGPLKETWLNVEKIIFACKDSGADAIHPGYGFLSENPDLPKACEHNGIIFIGPDAESMSKMGDKARAREIMENSEVPVVPGFHGKEQNLDLFLKEAEKIGYPVMLKPSAGGGGKGMRVISESEEFESSLESAKRESLNAFGDDRMILEKFVSDPRHIEVQVLFDSNGNGVHLYERDCSVQRRNQKIIEESPAPGINSETLEKITEVALKAARAVNYRNAGTVEFIYSEASGDFYFMEMNTRLQVEHPVTEMITGVDLVKEQIQIAEGNKISFSQEEISRNGHAIEVRVYAEDPSQDFLPSSGFLDYYQEPSGDGIRVDSGVGENCEISTDYDPMISKLICHGNTRDEAIDKSLSALKNYWILGPDTNISFLIKLMNTEKFRKGSVTTALLKDVISENLLKPADSGPLELMMAALYGLNDAIPNEKTNSSTIVDVWGVRQGTRLNADHFSPWRSR